MPTINQLPLQTNITSGDQLPIYSPNNGDARRISMGSLLSFFQSSFASPDLATYLTTPGSGFNITVPTPITSSVWMLLQPAGTLGEGTLTLPLNTQTPSGTEILVTTTQQISAFDISLNGAIAVYGAPSVLAANDNFRIRYYQPTNAWYKVA
jgi:hypothetical protein